ncbi:hypothetical protein GCM10025759_33330 [Lysobacter panacisoli]|uniref:Uncharacterized protein n=1 Tax=Lysobacter panacisoli TaxID=1255263 RepID=A0ABP9LSQ2_9GAMM
MFAAHRRVIALRDQCVGGVGAKARASFTTHARLGAEDTQRALLSGPRNDEAGCMRLGCGGVGKNPADRQQRLPGLWTNKKPAPVEPVAGLLPPPRRDAR